MDSPWPWAIRLLSPHGYGEKMHKCMEQVRYWLGERERERESVCVSLYPWDCISLMLGQTRCLFKSTNQIPKLLWALDVFAPSS